jgi:hypothetical protein
MFRFLVRQSSNLKKQTELANVLTQNKIETFIEIYAKLEYTSFVTYKQVMLDFISYCVSDKA